jgi:deoxyribodipyrimidine photo-lyase
MTDASEHVPAERLRLLRDAPPHADGGFVLYWMIAARRTRFNFALERAVGLFGFVWFRVLVLLSVLF